DGGNVLCGAAITGSVVGEHKVVVNGLGNPNKTDGAVDGHGVGAQLGNGVHAVVSANVEHSLNIVFLQDGEDGFVGIFILGKLRQLEPAGTQVTGGSALEQFNAHVPGEKAVQIHQAVLKESFNAEFHSVYF